MTRPARDSEGWGPTLRRASLIGVWMFSFVSVSALIPLSWERWRTLVNEHEGDLDPRPRDDGAYPEAPEAAAARVAEARHTLRSFNLQYGGRFGLCICLAAGLIAAPMVRRQRRRAAPPWEAPPRTGRSWALAILLAGVLLVGALILVAMTLRGALSG